MDVFSEIIFETRCHFGGASHRAASQRACILEAAGRSQSRISLRRDDGTDRDHWRRGRDSSIPAGGLPIGASSHFRESKAMVANQRQIQTPSYFYRVKNEVINLKRFACFAFPFSFVSKTPGKG